MLGDGIPFDSALCRLGAYMHSEGQEGSPFLRIAAHRLLDVGTREGRVCTPRRAPAGLAAAAQPPTRPQPLRRAPHADQVHLVTVPAAAGLHAAPAAQAQAGAQAIQARGIPLFLLLCMIANGSYNYNCKFLNLPWSDSKKNTCICHVSMAIYVKVPW